MLEEVLESTRSVDEESAASGKTKFKPHLKVVKGTDNVDVYIKEGVAHLYKMMERNLVLIMSKKNEIIGKIKLNSNVKLRSTEKHQHSNEWTRNENEWVNEGRQVLVNAKLVLPKEKSQDDKKS